MTQATLDGDIAALQDVADDEFASAQSPPRGAGLEETKGLPPPWRCPVCSTEVPLGSKTYHAKTRHPEVPFARFQVERPTTVAVSHDLPDAEADWKCPICQGKLPILSSQGLLRAKRAHVAEAHPGTSLSELYRLSALGRPKVSRKIGAKAKEAHEAKRQQRFQDHDMVTVIPPERVRPGCRGSLTYCRKCFSLLGKVRDDTLRPCNERLKELQTNLHVQRVKGIWWARLTTNEPLHAEAFARAVGRSVRELDKLLYLHGDHTDRSIQIAREFSLANGAVRLAFRKRGKLPLSRAEVALASARKRPAPKQLAPRAKSSAKRPRPERSGGVAGTGGAAKENRAKARLRAGSSGRKRAGPC